MLDLDNTIFDTKPLLMAGFKDQRFYRPPTTYNIDLCYPLEISSVLRKIFDGDAVYHTPLLFQDYTGIVNALQRNYKVLYITHRNSVEKTQKQLYLNRISTKPEQIILTKEQSKITTILDKHVDFVVDDSPYVIAACIPAGLPHLMVSTSETPYNYKLRKIASWDTSLHTLMKRIQYEQAKERN